MKNIAIPGRKHCTKVGTRQAQLLFRCRSDPYVVQPARILPNHQKLLYTSTMKWLATFSDEQGTQSEKGGVCE